MNIKSYTQRTIALFFIIGIIHLAGCDRGSSAQDETETLPEIRTLAASAVGSECASLTGRIKKFEYVDGPKMDMTSDREFRGGVQVDNGNIVFIPRMGIYVGEYDPYDNTFMHTAKHGTGGFGMGTALNDGYTVIMTPRGSRYVGIYDARTQTYTNGASHGIPSDNAFLGSAKVSSDLIVFGPLLSEVVGLYNPETDIYRDGPEHNETDMYNFSTIALSTVTGDVILTPFHSEHVGIYNPADNTYTSGATHNAGTGEAYSGSVEAGGKIIMAPRSADHVGIYDPLTDTFTKGPKHGEGTGAFMAAQLWPSGEVLMAPYRSDHVGIYNPETGEYRSGPSVAHVEAANRWRFSGAILTKEKDRLVMTNRGADIIGIVRETPYFSNHDQAAVFFRYRPAGEQQWQETEKLTVTSADAFQYDLSGLTSGTEYEYAAVIQSGDVERMGSLERFVTSFGQEDGY